MSRYGNGAISRRFCGSCCKNFVSEHELTHLRKLQAPEPFHFKKSDSFEAELKRLLSLGLIARRPGHGFRSLFSAGDDVHNHLEITNRGTSYLADLNDVERSDMDL